MADGEPLAGRCLCGAVRVTLDDPEFAVEICQCSICRRWGGAFHAGQRGGSVSIEGEGSASLYRSSDWAERAFCNTCGTSLWFRFLPTGARSFSAGLFEAAGRHAIEQEIFCDEAARWTALSGNHPRLTGAQTVAETRAAGFIFN